MKNTKKGELVPQTVENLQAIMARDAIYTQELDEQLTQQTTRYNKLLAKYNKRGRKKTVLVELVVRVRNALADYMRAEGCDCCREHNEHAEAAKRLATLLNVPAYDDGSGFNFSIYQTKE